MAPGTTLDAGMPVKPAFDLLQVGISVAAKAHQAERQHAVDVAKIDTAARGRQASRLGDQMRKPVARDRAQPIFWRMTERAAVKLPNLNRRKLAWTTVAPGVDEVSSARRSRSAVSMARNSS